jgi:2-oxoglutarate ferredoxin oxidoreductase subunit delta
MTEKERDFKRLTDKTKRGSWTVLPELCKGCGLCIQVCPTDVITYSKELGSYGTERVQCDACGCITCGKCAEICPDSAIEVKVEKPKQRRNESGEKA